jgi:hypothetical protein
MTTKRALAAVLLATIAFPWPHAPEQRRAHVPSPSASPMGGP